MPKHIYTTAQEQFIVDKVAKRRHFKLWTDDFNATFGTAQTWYSLDQKARRLGLNVDGLNMTTQKERADLKEYKARLEEKTDEQLRAEEIERMEREQKERFDKRELKRLRERERFEDRLLDIIKEKLPAIQPIKFRPTPKDHVKTSETFVALLSDTHFGEVVDPEIMDGLNCYNFSVAARRIEHYAHTIIKLATDTFQGYEFPRLVLFLLGDMVSGRIHEELIETQDMDCVEQVFDGAEIVADFVRTLLPHFGAIHIVARPGNHGRFGKKKAYKQPHYNWDYFLYRTVQQVLSEQDRISWDLTKAYQAHTEIEGWDFMSYHGDDIQSWMGIPWYGLQRHDMKMTGALAARQQYHRYVLLGHFHSEAKIARPGGKIIVNGSVSGTDEYCWHRIGAYEPAEQKVFSVHQDNGITIELTVNLQEV